MKRNYDVFIIGHISKDEIVINGNVRRLIGGSILYASYASMVSGAKIGVLTKLAEEDKQLLQEFPCASEDIYYVYSKSTTSIRNIYFSNDQERRICTALAIADPFTLADLPNVEAKIYYLAGLIAGDYENQLIEILAKKGKIALDIQGFIRHVEKDGTMVFKDWIDKLKYLPFVDFLKADAAEAEFLTGSPSKMEAAKIFYSWGAKEIMITDRTEVMIYDGEEFYFKALKPRKLSGRTGRGDTCFGSYISRRLREEVESSLLFAAALVSLKMETPGPFKGSTEDIKQYICEIYGENKI